MNYTNGFRNLTQEWLDINLLFSLIIQRKCCCAKFFLMLKKLNNILIHRTRRSTVQYSWYDQNFLFMSWCYHERNHIVKRLRRCSFQHFTCSQQLLLLLSRYNKSTFNCSIHLIHKITAMIYMEIFPTTQKSNHSLMYCMYWIYGMDECRIYKICFYHIILTVLHFVNWET